jgi:hypothetical protein
MTVLKQVELVEMMCGECEILFAVPAAWKWRRQEDGRTWYCPNGHPRVYRESENDRLKRELAEAHERAERNRRAAERARTQRGMAERSAAAYKGQATKLRKRAAAGVCPCCHRTFQQLARHMQNKHPKFVAEQRTEPPAAEA